MVDLVLQQRYSAVDVEAASSAVRSVFGVGQVTAAEGEFSYEQQSLVDDGISVTRISSSGTEVRIRSVGSPDLCVFVVQAGQVTLRRGTDEVEIGEGALGLIPLDEPVEMQWDTLTIDVYSLPVTSLRRLLGSEDRSIVLRAPLLTCTAEPLAAFWKRLAGVLATQVLREADLYSRDLVRTQMVDALTAATIEAFSISESSEDDGDRDVETLRRALAFLRTKLGAPISVLDMAAASGISVRGLQVLFQRNLGSTPVAHLRRLRLEAARRELSAPRSGTAVGAVARQFGYSNLGRFSAHYLSEFDEHPSRTLQRGLAALRNSGEEQQAPAGEDGGGNNDDS